MTYEISIDKIIDTIMAADGISATLDRNTEGLRVINEAHIPALKQLIQQAIAFIAAQHADIITGYTISDTDIAVEINDNAVGAGQLQAAITWLTLQFSYAGIDDTRAKAFATLATNTLSALSLSTSFCPPHRPLSY